MQTNNVVGLFRKSHGSRPLFWLLGSMVHRRVLLAIPPLGPESHIFYDHGNPIVLPFHTTGEHP